MLTKPQVEQLAKNFQIDSFSLFREYLQLIFLNYLFMEKQAEKIYFKGGTCLRLIYNSPRFSEDLDFSTMIGEKQVKEILNKIIKKIQKEIPQIKLIFIWRGKKSIRYQLKYQSEEFKYPLTIRLDFSFEKIFLPLEISKIETQIPISFLPLISHLNQKEILTEKIRAFLTRAKGRDIFDFWLLLGKNIDFDEKLLERKLERNFNKKQLITKIKKYPDKKLEMDLAKFLPLSYRKIIPFLKKEVLEKLGN